MKVKIICGSSNIELEEKVVDFFEESKVSPDDIVGIGFGKYANVYEVLIIYTGP